MGGNEKCVVVGGCLSLNAWISARCMFWKACYQDKSYVCRGEEDPAVAAHAHSLPLPALFYNGGVADDYLALDAWWCDGEVGHTSVWCAVY